MTPASAEKRLFEWFRRPLVLLAAAGIVAADLAIRGWPRQEVLVQGPIGLFFVLSAFNQILKRRDGRDRLYLVILAVACLLACLAMQVATSQGYDRLLPLLCLALLAVVAAVMVWKALRLRAAQRRPSFPPPPS